MKNYGEAFRYFRKLNGYSLEYAAADSISKSQLSRFERGENEISLSFHFGFSIGGIFQKGLSSKRKFPILDPSFLHPRHLLWDFHPAYERSLYWELPLGLRPISALDLFIWRPGRSRLALVFTRSSLL